MERDDDEPSGWRWLPGLRSKHDVSALDADGEYIKRASVLKPPSKQIPYRYNVSLSCDCGLRKRLRAERLAPVLERCAQLGVSRLPLSKVTAKM